MGKEGLSKEDEGNLTDCMVLSQMFLAGTKYSIAASQRKKMSLKKIQFVLLFFFLEQLYFIKDIEYSLNQRKVVREELYHPAVGKNEVQISSPKRIQLFIRLRLHGINSVTTCQISLDVRTVTGEKGPDSHARI